MSHGYLAGRPYPQDTRETQLSPSVLTLRIPVMCRAHALLRGMLSREIPTKTSSVFNSLSLHTLSLSITQPLQSNPTINTRYKRLIKITIKFGMELRPPKHIVVNHNFTVRMLKTWSLGRNGLEMPYLLYSPLLAKVLKGYNFNKVKMWEIENTCMKK